MNTENAPSEVLSYRGFGLLVYWFIGYWFWFIGYWFWFIGFGLLVYWLLVWAARKRHALCDAPSRARRDTPPVKCTL
jgi:hypothetical protein